MREQFMFQCKGPKGDGHFYANNFVLIFSLTDIFHTQNIIIDRVKEFSFNLRYKTPCE